MSGIIFFIGLIVGLFLNVIANKISSKIVEREEKKASNFLKRDTSARVVVTYILIALICGFLFLIGFLRFGINIKFIKFALLCSISIIVSPIDFKHRIIPDSIVVITLILGILLSCVFDADISYTNTALGMLAGGGLLFVLALIPGAMGGGDVKLMFALGSFLGLNRTLWSLVLTFVLASIIIVLLLLFKVIGRKSHIPFGPFLALGAMAALYVF
jgi:leader peptidase (prepilin peptidase) / N-methyltransferase